MNKRSNFQPTKFVPSKDKEDRTRQRIKKSLTSAKIEPTDSVALLTELRGQTEASGG